MKLSVNKKILDSNDKAAQRNRQRFAELGLACINVVSSPGSGKTTLLARTVRDLAGRLRMGVIEGDIKTDTDARAIRAAGAPAVQIETEGACHLSARQVHAALDELPLGELDMVFIENVGNLVCPSAFDLGENRRVVVLSVPEGDDKPCKYPGTFAVADVIVINKIDLLEYIEFSLERVLADISKVNRGAKVFEVSARTGRGMEQWYEWLLSHTAKSNIRNQNAK